MAIGMVWVGYYSTHPHTCNFTKYPYPQGYQFWSRTLTVGYLSTPTHSTKKKKVPLLIPVIHVLTMTNQKLISSNAKHNIIPEERVKEFEVKDARMRQIGVVEGGSIVIDDQESKTITTLMKDSLSPTITVKGTVKKRKKKQMFHGEGKKRKTCVRRLRCLVCELL